MNESNASSFARRHETGIVTLGFTCLYVVAIVFFYSDWISDVPQADPLAYLAVLNGALCAGAALSWLAARREGDAGRRPSSSAHRATPQPSRF